MNDSFCYINQGLWIGKKEWVHPVALWRAGGQLDVHMILLFTIITSKQDMEKRRKRSTLLV